MAWPVLQHQGLVKDEAQLCVWMLTDAQALGTMARATERKGYKRVGGWWYAGTAASTG